MNERERRRAYNPPQHKGYNKPNIPKKYNKGGNRNYDKPWVKKEKKKKKGSKDDEDSYLYHCYPDGNGPDSELIKMLERDVLLKHPKVTFDDVADLDQAKETL
jgi:katanin p60 ATPase-containing subunit A1